LRGDAKQAMEDIDRAEVIAKNEGLLPDVAGLLALRAAAGLPNQRAAALGSARDIMTSLGMRRELAQLPAEQAARAPDGLSAREVEVLALVAQGLTNREIAERLVLSERTVINHLSHIFNKTGVENRAAATAYAFRNGLT